VQDQLTGPLGGRHSVGTHRHCSDRRQESHHQHGQKRRR
jgi:hypothetical protein